MRNCGFDPASYEALAFRVLVPGPQKSAQMAELLTPLARDFEAGRLRFRRSGSRGRYPNPWEVVDI
jgi:hypothetical protein